MLVNFYYVMNLELKCVVAYDITEITMKINGIYDIYLVWCVITL